MVTQLQENYGDLHVQCLTYEYNVISFDSFYVLFDGNEPSGSIDKFAET